MGAGDSGLGTRVRLRPLNCYTVPVTKNKRMLYAGALVLEAIVLAALWLVGHHFTTP